MRRSCDDFLFTQAVSLIFRPRCCHHRLPEPTIRTTQKCISGSSTMVWLLDNTGEVHLKFREASYILPRSSVPFVELLESNPHCRIRKIGATENTSSTQVHKSWSSNLVRKLTDCSEKAGNCATAACQPCLFFGEEILDVAPLLPAYCQAQTFKALIDFLLKDKLPSLRRPDVFELLKMAQLLGVDRLGAALAVAVCDGMRREGGTPDPVQVVAEAERQRLAGAGRLVQAARDLIVLRLPAYCEALAAEERRQEQAAVGAGPGEESGGGGGGGIAGAGEGARRWGLADLPLPLLCEELARAAERGEPAATTAPLAAALRRRRWRRGAGAAGGAAVGTRAARLVLGCARRVRRRPRDLPRLALLAHQQGHEDLLTSFFIPEISKSASEIPSEEFAILPLNLLIAVLSRDDLAVRTEDEVFQLIRQRLAALAGAPGRAAAAAPAAAAPAAAAAAGRLWRCCRALWLSRPALQALCADRAVPEDLLRRATAGMACLQSGLGALLEFVKSECSDDDTWRSCLIPRRLSPSYVNNSCSFHAKRPLRLAPEEPTGGADGEAPARPTAAGGRSPLERPGEGQPTAAAPSVPGDACEAAAAAAAAVASHLLERHRVIEDYVAAAEQGVERRLDRRLFGPSPGEERVRRAGATEIGGGAGEEAEEKWHGVREAERDDRLAYHLWLWDGEGIGCWGQDGDGGRGGEDDGGVCVSSEGGVGGFDFLVAAGKSSEALGGGKTSRGCSGGCQGGGLEEKEGGCACVVLDADEEETNSTPPMCCYRQQALIGTQNVRVDFISL